MTQATARRQQEDRDVIRYQNMLKTFFGDLIKNPRYQGLFDSKVLGLPPEKRPFEGELLALLAKLITQKKQRGINNNLSYDKMLEYVEKLAKLHLETKKSLIELQTKLNTESDLGLASLYKSLMGPLIRLNTGGISGFVATFQKAEEAYKDFQSKLKYLLTNLGQKHSETKVAVEGLKSVNSVDYSHCLHELSTVDLAILRLNLSKVTLTDLKSKCDQVQAKYTAIKQNVTFLLQVNSEVTRIKQEASEKGGSITTYTDHRLAQEVSERLRRIFPEKSYSIDLSISNVLTVQRLVSSETVLITQNVPSETATAMLPHGTGVNATLSPQNWPQLQQVQGEIEIMTQFLQSSQRSSTTSTSTRAFQHGSTLTTTQVRTLLEKFNSASVPLGGTRVGNGYVAISVDQFGVLHLQTLDTTRDIGGRRGPRGSIPDKVTRASSTATSRSTEYSFTATYFLPLTRDLQGTISATFGDRPDFSLGFECKLTPNEANKLGFSISPISGGWGLTYTHAQRGEGGFYVGGGPGGFGAGIIFSQDGKYLQPLTLFPPTPLAVFQLLILGMTATTIATEHVHLALMQYLAYSGNVREIRVKRENGSATFTFVPIQPLGYHPPIPSKEQLTAALTNLRVSNQEIPDMVTWYQSTLEGLNRGPVQITVGANYTSEGLGSVGVAPGSRAEILANLNQGKECVISTAYTNLQLAIQFLQSNKYNQLEFHIENQASGNLIPLDGIKGSTLVLELTNTNNNTSMRIPILYDSNAVDALANILTQYTNLSIFSGLDSKAQDYPTQLQQRAREYAQKLLTHIYTTDSYVSSCAGNITSITQNSTLTFQRQVQNATKEVTITVATTQQIGKDLQITDTNGNSYLLKQVGRYIRVYDRWYSLHETIQFNNGQLNLPNL